MYSLKQLFNNDQFMPHGHCYLWRPDILWFNVVSDALIAGAYFAIPLAFLHFILKRRDVKYNWLIAMFALFIIACGTTHVLDVWTIWNPQYGLQIVVKMLTAAVSVATAIAIWPILPKAVALASANQLEIQNRKLAKENAELRKSEALFRSMIHGVKDYAIFLLDPNGFVTTWSLGAEQMKGYRPDEAIGQHLSIFYPKNQLESGEAGSELSVAQEMGQIRTEGWRVRKDGSRFWANILLTAIYSDTGELTGFCKVTRDATQSRRVDAVLKKQAEKMKSIVDTVFDGVIAINARFQIESWNPAAARIFGYEAEEVIGKNVNMLMPEPFHSAHDGYVNDYIRTGDAKIIGIGREVSGLRKSGEIFPMDLSVSEFSLGEQRFFTGIVRDITQQKRLELARVSADSANAAKSSFLANMSHEIRTPLGAVVGFAELLADSGLSALDRAQFVAAIKRNSELLSNIINDVLDLSKVEAEKIDLDMQDTTLHYVLSDVTQLLKLKATEKGLHLTIDSDGDVPLLFRTDPLRLRQVLLNIVGNAIKFTKQGSVQVKISYDILAQDGRLNFAVIDTGMGISHEQRSLLFKPFSQADCSVTRTYGGTGLGLVLAKRLAKLLGGDLVLTASALNKGSTFTITIDPGPVAPEAFARFVAHVPAEQPCQPHGETRLDGVRILLVEDAPDNRVLVERLLRMTGASVDTAQNGMEALEKVYKFTYDVVLMDLQMPVLDGYATTSRLRKEGNKTPIVALTGHALKEERQVCLDSGFSDYLTKPVDRRALISRVALYARRSNNLIHEVIN